MSESEKVPTKSKLFGNLESTEPLFNDDNWQSCINSNMQSIEHLCPIKGCHRVVDIIDNDSGLCDKHINIAKQCRACCRFFVESAFKHTDGERCGKCFDKFMVYGDLYYKGQHPERRYKSQQDRVLPITKEEIKDRREMYRERSYDDKDEFVAPDDDKEDNDNDPEYNADDDKDEE